MKEAGSFESQGFEPPGQTESPRAERALVLAPHFDDEVIGCGGLIGLLVASGARVVVAFLTDSSGGAEGPPEGVPAAAYAARRRREALAACRRLGVEEPLFWSFADGALASHRRELGERLRDLMLEVRPDLVLAPSPLEVTSDHRAAFAALYDTLSPLRGGSELDAIAARLDVLCYEVNHPAYPDLLVDVSDQVELIESAMTCYESQQERHDYLGAALGLRRYRTHTLPPAVEAAEAYRRLRLEDFTTRSPAALVQKLGGSPSVFVVEESPRISIVVRTRDRPQLLCEALASLAATRYPSLEVVLVNDGGQPPSVAEELGLDLVRVDLDDSRGRASAANEGLRRAGGDWVGFLDDDDLVFPEHLACLAGAVRSAGVTVVYSDAAVATYRVAPGRPAAGEGGGWINVERRLPYSRDFDPDVLLVDNYIPFHSILIERELALSVAPLDEELEIFEDWDFLIRLADEAPFHHLRRVTCEYRHFEGSGHHALGGRPTDARFAEVKARVLEKHRSRLTPERLGAAISRLRRETVELVEAQSRQTMRHREEELARGELVVRLRRDIEEQRRQLVEQSLERERLAQRSFDLEAQNRELEAGYHRLHGELRALEGERARADAQRDAELRRVYDREGALDAEVRAVRAGFEDRGQRLEESRAEVAWLQHELEQREALIREMEGTRAWRWHQRLERLRGAGRRSE